MVELRVIFLEMGEIFYKSVIKLWSESLAILNRKNVLKKMLLPLFFG